MPYCKKPILHIDLETYSSVDLAACGVYKYAESLDFKILLFGYAWGNDPVEVLNLMEEDLPFSLVSALADESITKVAHNANFERVCLTRYVKEYAKRDILGEAVKKKLTEDGFLPPEQWKDTMIMAAEN